MLAMAHTHTVPHHVSHTIRYSNASVQPIDALTNATYTTNLDLRDAIKHYTEDMRLVDETAAVIEDARQCLAAAPPHCETVPHLQRMCKRAITLCRTSPRRRPSSQLHSTALALLSVAESCFDDDEETGHRQWHRVPHHTARVQELAQRVSTLVASESPTLQIGCADTDDNTVGRQCLEVVQQQVDTALAQHAGPTEHIVCSSSLCGKVAQWACEQCELDFCTQCDDATHSAGWAKKHAQHPRQRLDRLGSALQQAAYDLGVRLSSQQPTAAPNIIDEKDIVYDRPKKRIGAGAFGTVFEATWMGTRVAVKRLNKGAHIALGSTDSGVGEGARGSSWNRELGILSAVAHPNVASFYGATQPVTRDGEVRLVFELLFTDVQHLIHSPGDACLHNSAELAKFAELIRFDEPSTKLRIVFEVASAMTYLHAHKPRPVLHRDLKLANVMLSKDGVSKLIDFGQARAHDSTMSFKTGWAGTPLYMAPEVMNYDAVYNKQVDQFSFGMMVWELWTETVPYAALRDPPLEQLRKLKLAGRPPGDLVELERAGCPKSVVCVAEECWHPDPNRRPPFDEVYQRLRLATLGIADDGLPPSYEQSCDRPSIPIAEATRTFYRIHSSGGSANGAVLTVGPRGGASYINKNGNRTYPKNQKQFSNEAFAGSLLVTALLIVT
jgi:serine/threonine protein kinase